MSDALPAYPIESVDRALSVILEFEHAEAMTVTETGRLLEVSRSTAYRLLSQLEHRGFVRQDKRTKAFHPGPALLRVGLAAAQRSDIRVALRPLLEQVAAACDETAHLMVLQNDAEVFFMDCVEGSKVIRATPRVGATLPAHVTSGGKVLLAHLPEDQLELVLGGELPRVTRRSKTSATTVRRELAQVRAQGWAVNDGESEEDLRAVAVLVPGAPERGGADAAVSIAGPIGRMTDARVAEIARVLQDAVGELTGVRAGDASGRAAGATRSAPATRSRQRRG